MNVSLYQAAAAMNAQVRWQELITENLAAGTVPGFRKREVSFAAVEAGMDPTAARDGNMRYVIPTAIPGINFDNGELRPTGNPTDLAIEGPGFFEVSLPNGDHAYTRDGEFRLNVRGQLVTKQGYAVLSDGGPVQIDPTKPGPVSVSPTGEISQGGETKGALRVVEFDRRATFTPIGQGYFLSAESGALPPPASNSFLRQGFLELPNTSPVAEMASLITSMRMFEANQKVLQMQDERMGRVISELAGS
jgi:flagellar basal-body rod protein FlgF